MPNVIDAIEDNPKPGDLASWWGKQDKNKFAISPLEPEEQDYIEFYTSDEVPKELWIGRGFAEPDKLTEEDKERARKNFGETRGDYIRFCNWENRRRIVAHYVYTHPATIAYQLQLYRLTRDVVPPLFIAERAYELFTGEEAFTGEKISRIWAAAELALLVVGARLFRAARMGLEGPSPSGPPRALTEPIWDLPPEGGGMKINGRWYTEHALERMAPDTAEIRAAMRTRVANRLNRIGIMEGSPAWDACFGKAMQKINPRGVPPSVVEQEILRPGSTNVKVITASRKRVVVTVIPR